VSNAWVTYPWAGDNHSKGWLIPRKTTGSTDPEAKGGTGLPVLPPWDGPASD
jgi:hypothetical protein